MSKIYLAEKSQLDSAKTHFATCSTAAATAAKTVTASGFTLKTGAMISVKFTYANTAENPTLNVSGTGAKSIYYHNLAVPAGMFAAGGVYLLVYNGSRWEVMGNHFEPSIGSDLKSVLVQAFTGTTVNATENEVPYFVKQVQVDFSSLSAQGYKAIFLSGLSLHANGSAMNDHGFFRLGIFDGNNCISYASYTMGDNGITASSQAFLILKFQNITGIKTLAYYIYQETGCYSHTYSGMDFKDTYLLT